MLFVKKGYGFHVNQDFARAKENIPFEVDYSYRFTGKDAYIKYAGRICGHIPADPNSTLGFMKRGDSNGKIRIITDRRGIIES